jgi:parvulin-like peptidyl-prolyl isomerase
MAKKGKEQQKQVASKHVTTRRLARWQQEKRRQRITFFSGIVIIVIVIGIIVGGIIATRTSDWLSKVQADSGTITIKKADYANELKLLQAGIQAGIYNSSATTNESPLRMLEDNYLNKDKAKEVGVTVSKTETDNTLLAIFGMANKSISDTDFQQAYQNALGTLSISDKEFRDIIEGPLLNQKLTNYFINQSPISGPQANISIFVVSNISMANELAQKWRNGEEITALSAEYGIYSQSIWLPKGYVGGEFDTVAFTIEIGNVSDPIPTNNISGATSSSDEYYVIKVLERKDDVISDSMRQQWGSKEYNTWYLQAQQDKVERNPKLDLSEVYAWAVKQLS